MRISLNNYPSPPKTYVMDFPKLNGGLNLEELAYRLDANESPMMKNLWWEDGILQSRAGQLFLSSDEIGVGYTCAPTLFFDNAFFHIGGGIYCGNPSATTFELTKLVDGVPENRGTFFRYLDWLFYKNKGGYFRISYDSGAGTFAAESLASKAYTPVIQINTDPATGAGDLYQPENRLTEARIVRFKAADNATVYHLPEKGIRQVTNVADLNDPGITISVSQVDHENGIVTLERAINFELEITYEKANDGAYESIMDCEYAMVAGGDTNLCLLLAGCDSQPNAVFWNDRDSVSMNPTYFPVPYYNLVGDTEDPVAGFGRQYADIIVLKEHSVGKLSFGVEDLDGRNSISFAYTNINTKIGCDLPWSIQLVENNLVFCNTYQGVQILRSSSAAYENNVECISRKVNGNTAIGFEDNAIPGLLHDIRSGGVVVSHDDDCRYWLCANGKAYVWDYTVSSHENPSWFYLTGISPVALFVDHEHRSHHLDALGRVTRFGRFFQDYGAAIDKVYQSPVLSFGGYDRLKDVTDVILVTRSDTETEISIEYTTDYETRKDLTDVFTWDWSSLAVDLGTTILGYYNLAAPVFARAVRRRPGCRHIRHFALTLSNNIVGEDLAVVSAQVYYRMQGRER